MVRKPVKYHEGGFPPKNLKWEQLIPLIGPANAALARYDGILAAVPNAPVLLSPLMNREAVLSSRIEGTQADTVEVLEYEAGLRPGSHDENHIQDIHEIINYRKAMGRSVEQLQELPLCQRVIKKAHKTLMEGVRGEGKAPGEYRRMPNWIGPLNAKIEKATYISISAEKLPSAMDEWEKFIHCDCQDKLVQLALLHAEFEALHPFLDGNGRVGRILIPLFLFGTGLLHKPLFYMSAYLEAHRDEYYERLLAVSRDGDWTGWCVFFLDALLRQAEENLEKANAILNLYETEKARFVKVTGSKHAIRALDFIFMRPIFSTKAFTDESGIAKSSAKRIMKILSEQKIINLLQEGKGQQSAIYVYQALLDI
jgi:cell filamentation protein, protein adenylyltransferase